MKKKRGPSNQYLRAYCIDLLHAVESGHLSTLVDETKHVAEALLKRVEAEGIPDSGMATRGKDKAKKTGPAKKVVKKAKKKPTKETGVS